MASLLSCKTLYGQTKPVATDTVRLYKNIETYSGRNQFTRFMYRLIFKPVSDNVKKSDSRKKKYKRSVQKPYSNFEGKIIRNISIVTLDPFGYTVGDTLKYNLNFLTAAGNGLHVKSQHITIRNLLLIHKNQVFDSLLVKESERLVRSQSYIRDVSFYVVATHKNSDSVDIFIRELDNWSIIPNFSASPSNVTLSLSDKNFLGTGHESKNNYSWNPKTRNNAYNLGYYIPNIRNSFISASIGYNTDEFRNYNKILAFDRPFFSPFADWAAGISITQKYQRDSIWISESQYVDQRVRFNTQDYWAGSAIQIFKGNSENNRTTNFISTLRYVRIRYLEKPENEINEVPRFSDENFVLASFGVSTRKYIQDTYVFRYGVTEDVPIGKLFSLTTGFQKKTSGRFFLGARIAWGDYYNLGYLGSNLEFNTFFNGSHPEQGTFVVGINYFTGLKVIGKWKLRHFVKPQLTMGLNRFENDSLTLNDGFGLDGFNGAGLTGTSRLLFTFQTQSYAPWNVIGFRFGPFLVCSLGLLGDEVNNFKNSKVYSQIGLGVLIKNESLVINSFQVSFSYYPVIPGRGFDILKFNSFRTTDFGFRDFEIGKPVISSFR